MSKAPNPSSSIPAENAAEKEQPANTQGWQRQNGENERIVDAIAAINRTLASEGASNRREERREDTGNKWLQGLTLAFVIATTVGIFWQASIFNGQLDEMKGASVQTNKLIGANAKLAEAAGKQADAAQKQADALAEAAKVSHENMILAERAWVGPNNATLAAEPAVGKLIEIVIAYQNTGRQPALNFLYFGEPFSATTAEDADGTAARTLAQYMEKCKAAKEWPGGSVIYPSTGFSAYSLSVKTKDDFVDEAVTKSDKIVFFQGCFLYRTFDAPRHSYFCYFYKQGQTKIQNLNICPSGQYAD